MSLKFRASPWVTYHPTVTPPSNPPPAPSTRMDEDVNMDAPQISILREEETPPPQPKSTPRRNKAAKQHPTWTRPPRKEALTEEELIEDQEDEEDQLIDDDDEEKPTPTSSKSAPPPVEAGTKRKAPIKQRKPRKSDKRITEEEKKLREKAVQLPGAPNLAPTLTWFEATPSEVQSEVGGAEGGGGTLAFVDAADSLPSSGKSGETNSGKKKASKSNPRYLYAPSTLQESQRRKYAGTETPEEVPSEAEPTPVTIPTKTASAKGTGKKKGPAKGSTGAKASSKAKSKLSAVPLLPDDGPAASEGLRTPTVASSPVTATMDLPEPETPDMEPPPAIPPIPDDIQLDGIAQPQYPLPTKPFPVQPPPKIPTGFAPIIPLDKSGKRARHWRQAQREVRGIAGGRWFARAWVGEKESELATALAATAAQNKAMEENKLPGVSLPKLPAISISAPAGSRVGRPKGQKAANSLTASAAPSRDGSVGPDGPPGLIQPSLSVSNAPRAPTKMRITVQPEPSEPVDVDMAPVP